MHTASMYTLDEIRVNIIGGKIYSDAVKTLGGWVIYLLYIQSIEHPTSILYTIWPIYRYCTTNLAKTNIHYM